LAFTGVVTAIQRMRGRQFAVVDTPPLAVTSMMLLIVWWFLAFLSGIR
jgi:hypothetical protein